MIYVTVWQFLTGNLWRTAAIALALIAGVQTIRAELYQSRYNAEQSAHSETKANVRRAAAEAETKALKAKADAEANYRKQAEEADREHQAELAGANARAERYIAANRVRVQAASSAAGGPPAAPGGSGAQGADRSGEAPELVTVTPDDVRVCTENTVRLEEAREWALRLHP